MTWSTFSPTYLRKVTSTVPILSVHTKVDGYSIGEHPLVARLLKGAFNQRPLQPRYETTCQGQNSAIQASQDRIASAQ